MTVPSLPVGPQSIRVFAGSRLPSLDREAFFKELGETFMPGTPFILAPLGLAAYVPAAPDFEPDTGLPDELALIVYASLDVYRAARQGSITGRMYTHSHAALFDMTRSRGQFPGPPSAPDRLPVDDRWCWYLHDTPIEWQDGATRLLILRGRPPSGSLQEALLQATTARAEDLAAAGVDQVIALATPDYAALWLHSPGPVDAAPSALGIVPAGVEVVRDLVAAPAAIRSGSDSVAITGPAAFSFRFVRDLRFFL
ncbi:MAG TPA: hypothetical protein VFR81_22270 [Longimicrobium sp.]|nr:hypothetical protein [Longimicrobium sp.]